MGRDQDIDDFREAVSSVGNVKTVLGEMSKETERGRVLIGQEWLNRCLELLLRAKFMAEGISKKDQRALLKGFPAPFGSFAMRVFVCRAFGLLPHDTCDLLDSYRKIRNHCAHADVRVSLEDIDIQDSVRYLAESVNILEMPPSSVIESSVLQLSLQILKKLGDITGGWPDWQKTDTPIVEPPATTDPTSP